MRLSGWLVLGASSVFASLGCASARNATTPPPGSAAALERPACPSEVRAGLEGLDATADWRQVGEPGMRYCVPATWVRSPHARGDQWRDANASVSAANMSTIEHDFPRTPPTIAARRGFFEREIGGYEVEFWYQEFQQSPPYTAPRDSRSVDRRPEYPNGYQTFAVWRDAEVVMSGHAMTISGVTVLRAIVQTVRFDPVTAAPDAS